MPAQVMPVQVLLLLLLDVGGAQERRLPPARIGVIGAGIGGTAAAYFLRQKFGRDVHIDIFERGEVGGRMATLNVNGQDYEAGAILILPENLHMMHFIRELGLSTVPREFSPMGISNGDEFVFKESGWKIWDSMQLFLRYGQNPLQMNTWVDAGLDRFMRIYGYQSQDQAFSSNEGLFRALGQGGCTQGLNETMWEAMRKAGFSPKFISEMATPIMQLIYGQGANMNCFTGLMPLLAVRPGLWSVEGGNKLVCSGLVSASNARLISGNVLSLEDKTPQKGHSGKQYKVTYSSESGITSGLYDIVLIATPLQPEIANITFHNFNPPIPEFTRPYYKDVVTFVRGHINATFFGYRDPSPFKLRAILRTENPKFFIDGITMGAPVKRTAPKTPLDPPLWKVYSGKSLTKKQLNLLFYSYDSVKEKKWLAWPHYYLPIELPPIMLHDHMYYLNGIELLASAMEMSAIAAKNAALLAHHRWYGELEKVDHWWW